MTLEEIKDKLKKSVADYRYGHAVRTAETAAQLAKKFNIDVDKAYIAGLLHDCAKGFTDEPDAILALADEAGKKPTAVEMTDPVVFCTRN